MATIISGKELSASMKAEMAAAVKEFPAKYGRAPHLVVVLVGDDPASVSYVTGKAKASAEVGIRNTTIRRPAETGEAELLALIGELNADDGVDGILVQLPLPKHIDEDRVIAAIRREKDVDGFHPLNVANLWLKQPCTLPCTPKGIIRMLQRAGVEIAGKRAVVIDVGVNRDPGTGKLCGDVDYAAVEPLASVITPVPGGVGPMTIACLMENTVECFLRKMER